MATKLKYALAGVSAAQLPSSLQEQLDFVPLGTPDISGVLIAGPGAAGALTKEDIAAFFSSGLSVAAFRPDEAVADAIAATTGRVAPPAPLVLYKRKDDTVSFSSSIVGDWPGDESNQVIAEADLAADPAPAPAPSPLLKSDAAVPATGLEVPDGFFATKPGLLKKKDNDPTPPPAAAPNVTTVEKFTPPSRAAYISDHHLFSETVELGKQVDIDKIMNGSTEKQYLQYNYRADFHCYWHDGEGVAKPHFVLLMKQYCAFNPCFAGRTKQNNYAWEGWTKGFFMATVDLEPVTLVAHGAQSIRLADWAPKGHSVKGGKAFNFAYPMQLRVDSGQGGRSTSVPFTAQYDSANLFEDWMYKDKVDMAAHKPSWKFHLDRMWDPTISSVHDFGSWHSNMYNPDHVVDFGPQCINTLYMTGVSAWTVDCATKTGESGAIEPAPVTLELLFGIRAFMPAIHARAGCIHSAHHIWWHDRQFHFRKFIRLDDICKR